MYTNFNEISRFKLNISASILPNMVQFVKNSPHKDSYKNHQASPPFTPKASDSGFSHPSSEIVTLALFLTLQLPWGQKRFNFSFWQTFPVLLVTVCQWGSMTRSWLNWSKLSLWVNEKNISKDISPKVDSLLWETVWVIGGDLTISPCYRCYHEKILIYFWEKAHILSIYIGTSCYCSCSGDSNVFCSESVYSRNFLQVFINCKNILIRNSDS